MAIYAVKYNPSLTYIPGATQVGTLAVAIGDVDYSTGGWVAGVSDDNGYVIYSDTTSLNLVGRTTGGNTGTASSNMPTFYRSKFKTDGSLIQLINRIPGNTQSFNDINSAKAWLSSTGHTNILGGTYSGGGAGLGQWYFYSGEGILDTTPPIADGNAIFIDNTSDPGNTIETFNPNKSDGYPGNPGVSYLNFNIRNSSGVDHTTEFTNLRNNGGTISITQNGSTATYVLTIGMTNVTTTGGGTFLVVNTSAATQTATTTNPFVFADPITITIS